MNFLMRPAQSVVPDQQPTVPDPFLESHDMPKTATTLEGLIAEDPFPQVNDRNVEEVESPSTGGVGSSGKNQLPVEKHSDVTNEEGWVTIPQKELPENWSDAPDILSLRSLDRSFVFPGEQIHILACLLASKQDTEIITPFKVAAVMSKNEIYVHNAKQKKEKIGSNGTGQSTEQNGETLSNKGKIDKVDISASEFLLRMEDHKKQTESQLERFKNSHFFVRIAESDELLW